MIIKYHHLFDKHFDRPPQKLQTKVRGVIDIFRANPFAPSLHNHPLSGNMQDRRALNVTDDIRIVFREFDDYTLVLLLDVGGHDQVY